MLNRTVMESFFGSYHTLGGRLSGREWCRRNLRASRVAVVICTVVLLVGAGPAIDAQALPAAGDAIYSVDPCSANENLNQIATFFISDCRKASIRRKFPSQHLYKTVGSLKNGTTASEKQAWKLLNDSRFRK